MLYAGVLLLSVGLIRLTISKGFVNRCLALNGSVLRTVEKEIEGQKVTCPVIDYQLNQIHVTTDSVGCAPGARFQHGETIRLLAEFKDENAPPVLHVHQVGGLYGGVFFWFLFASLCLSFGYRDYKLYYRLRYYGVLINAKVAGVTNTDRYRQENPNIYFIEAVWEDPITQKIYRFTSDPLKFDPSELVKGQFVEILLDPKNPKRYEFNISAKTKIKATAE